MTSSAMCITLRKIRKPADFERKKELSGFRHNASLILDGICNHASFRTIKVTKKRGGIHRGSKRTDILFNSETEQKDLMIQMLLNG